MAGEGRARREVDDLRCREFLTHFNGGGIGVYPICPAFTIEAQWRHHRHNSLVKQQAQRLDIDAFSTRELMVGASEDPAGWAMIAFT